MNVRIRFFLLVVISASVIYFTLAFNKSDAMRKRDKSLSALSNSDSKRNSSIPTIDFNSLRGLSALEVEGCKAESSPNPPSCPEGCTPANTSETQLVCSCLQGVPN